MTLCPFRLWRQIAGMKERLKDQRDYDGKHAAEHIEPKITDFNWGEEKDQHNDLCTNTGDKCGVTTNAFEEKGHDKKAEDGAVKKRTDDIYCLDQIIKKGECHGKCHSDNAPYKREDMGNPNIVLLALILLNECLVTIHHRGGCKRIKF